MGKLKKSEKTNYLKLAELDKNIIFSKSRTVGNRLKNGKF